MEYNNYKFAIFVANTSDSGEIVPTPPSGGGGDSGGGGGGGAPTYTDVTVADSSTTSVLIPDGAAYNGVHMTGGGSGSIITIAHTANGKAPGNGNLAKNLHGVTLFGDGITAKSVSVALQAGVTTAAEQTLTLKLKGSTIGTTTGDAFISDAATGFFTTKNGAASQDGLTYKYNVALENEGTSVVQMSTANLPPTAMTITGSGDLKLDNVVAQCLQASGGVEFDASTFGGKLSMEVWANSDTSGDAIDLSQAKGIDVLTLHDAGAGALSVTVGSMKYDSSNSLIINGSKFGSDKLTITGGSGNDALLGGSGDDVLVGGTGADYLDGGAGADTIFAGAQTDFAGAETNDDAAGADTISGNNTVFLQAFNGNPSSANWLAGNAFTVVEKANILEGRGGNDKLVASTAKDVFLYQTGGTKSGRTPELSLNDLGDDTIYWFDVANDKILFMDQDSSGTGGQYGNREFSAGWTFGTTLTNATNYKHGALNVYKEGDAATAVKYAFGTAAYSAANTENSNVAVYIQTGAGGSSGDTIITIDNDIISGNAQTDGTLTITLSGVNGSTLTTADAIAAIFGATAV